MNIANTLQVLRKQFSFTQEEVETATGIGVSTLSDFENGKRMPSLGQLETLAEFYHKPFTFFFEESTEELQPILWRNEPDPAVKERLEAEFRELCRQYNNLEAWTNNRTADSFKDMLVSETVLDYAGATKLAERIIRMMGLGDYPGAVLKQVLEEVYDVKIFNLDLEDRGVAACLYDEKYGPAIFLNCNKKRWRNNFDLAHELFHLVTWKVRDKMKRQPYPNEEQLATCFASSLLMPAEKIRESIRLMQDEKGNISIEKLGDIARKFDVSFEALCWRLSILFRMTEDETKELIQKLEQYKEPREGEIVCEFYPPRYASLSVQALRNGEISINRFLQYRKHDKLTRNDAEQILASYVPSPVQLPAVNNS